MRRHALHAGLTALTLTAALLTVAPPASAATTTFPFAATQDSYVSSSNPNANFNGADSLRVGAAPTRISYLQFNVTRLTDPVSTARLRLHVQNATNAPSPNGGTAQQAGTAWSESTLTYANRPASVGAPLGSLGTVRSNTWYELDVTSAVTGNGLVAFALSSTNADGAFYDSRESGTYAPMLIITTGPPLTGDNVLLNAGDISACSTTGAAQTAQIIAREPGTVMAGGDLTDSGTAQQLADCYGPTWGQFKDRTKPILGNHDYITSATAKPTFDYFGPVLPPGKGYYSFDKAGWHIVVLNTNCSRVGGCQAGSAQEKWLRADLAAHPNRCTLAQYHHPLFSSGGRESSAVRPLFQALYDAGAEIVINGHNHQYERFAPQNPSGVAEPDRGIREFVVGTGGRPLQASFPEPAANSQVKNGTTFGVLKLTLSTNAYSWQFLPVAGKTFTDSGTGTCH
ncbi:DNRLRE domain-containing protein [Micromonospora sp. WMMC241]|uniref:CBM96 family carbohydrate-binding protein n=1 Tax=Micromonospora sp. WMMC241 TaxID=3015159 RepID=UPI0022B68B33|nr:DNRLRE domain-containing protein [Micromonospora sp. WMMC241]MCZ7440316.1 DNRLRE domain-containing protein [Micromonospora sp. WMMC241]